MTASYQWERCDTAGANCADIPGATAGTYTLEDADAGHTTRVSVTYTNAAGDDTARSAPTAVIDGNGPANTVAPLLSGTPRDGETLTLDDGDWTGTPTIGYALPVAALRRRRHGLRRHHRRHRPPPTTCRAPTSTARCAPS